MIRCPVDGSPCPDDLCHGGSCVQGGGTPLEYCDLCDTWFCPDYETCQCGPYDGEYDDF